MKPRYIIVKNWLPKKYQSLLDYGGGESGEFVQLLPKKRIKPVVADIGKHRKIKHEKWYWIGISPKQKLPFKKESFDVVTMLEVLEHVPEESKALEEVWRILRPGGTLIITSPHKGLFSWFDPGDFKFKFPKVHEWLYVLFYSRQEYIRKFKQEELFGDISARPILEHHHYTIRELRSLLEPKFVIKEVKYFSLFFPFLGIIRFLSEKLFKKRNKIWDDLIWHDSQLSCGKLSFYIGIYVQKRLK